MTDQKNDSHSNTHGGDAGHQKQKDDEHKKHGQKHADTKEEGEKDPNKKGDDEESPSGDDKKVMEETPVADITKVTAE